MNSDSTVTPVVLSIFITFIVMLLFYYFCSPKPNQELTTTQEEEGKEKDILSKLNKETLAPLIVVRKLKCSTENSTHYNDDCNNVNKNNERSDCTETKISSSSSSSTLSSLVSSSSYLDEEQGSFHPCHEQKSGIDIDMETLHGSTTCEICLSTYKVGDEIASSHNDQCIHHFHKDCIIDWLHTRQSSNQRTTCPVCRRDFL